MNPFISFKNKEALADRLLDIFAPFDVTKQEIKELLKWVGTMDSFP